MRQWWQSLEQRERKSILLAAIVLGFAIAYAFVWLPLESAREARLSTNRELQTQHTWMQQAVSRFGANQTGSSSGTPLLTVIDQSAKQRALGNAIQQIKPQGDNEVQVWLQAAEFDELARWLADLAKQQGVIVDSVSVRATDNAGRVDARLTLTRGRG